MPTEGNLPREDMLVEFFNAQKAQARKEREHLEEYWRRAENSYLNKHDFSKKKDWQAKLFYSITSPTINRASRMMKSMLLKSQDYFEMEYIGEEDWPLAHAFKQACKFYLNNASFPDRFAEAAQSGFTYAIGTLKLWPKQYKRTVLVDNRKVTRAITVLGIKTLNPWYCYWPKDWRFFIEDVWMTIPELLQKAESGIYDVPGKPGSGLRKVKRVIGSDYRMEKPGGDAADQEDERLQRLGINDCANEYRKPVLLSEYWGPIIDKRGNITHENQKFVVINEKYCIQQPIDNPFAHQNWPYIHIVPLKVLFRHFGEGLTWGVDPVQKELTNVLNIMSDSLKLRMAGVIEVNEDLMVDRNKPFELYPSKVLRRRGDPRQSALNFHPLGADPEWASGFVQTLRAIYENHTGVTEWLQAAPTLKGSPTATEVATKTSMGQGYFESIAEDIDRQGIVAAAEMTKDLVVQYFSDMGAYPSVQRIFENATGQIIGNLTRSEKEELLLGDWDVRARGLSLWFERKEQINKLARHNDFLKSIPQEIALTQVDWEAIGKMWSESIWGDPDKFWKRRPQQATKLSPQMFQALPGGELITEQEPALPESKIQYGGVY